MRVATFDDATTPVFEGVETLTLAPRDAGDPYIAVDTSPASAQILDAAGATGDLPQANVTGSPSVSEGEFAEFTVALSNPSVFDSIVNVTVAGQTAGDGSDFDGTTLEYDEGSSWVSFANGAGLTIPAGSDSVNVRVATLDDAGTPIFEGPESFIVSLSDAGDSNIAVDLTPATGVVTVLTGSGADKPVISINGSPNVSEGGFAEFTVELSNASNFGSLVNVTVADGTAVGTTDFNNVVLEFFNGTTWVSFANGSPITVPAGDTSMLVRVDTLDDSGTPVFEGTETFTIALSDAGDPNVSVVTTPASGTITDASGTGADIPEVSISGSPTVNEGNFAEFLVALSNPSVLATSVNVTVADGTATSGSDYSATQLEYFDGSSWVAFNNGDAMSIASGHTSVKVRVQTLSDQPAETFEGSETNRLPSRRRLTSTTWRCKTPISL